MKRFYFRQSQRSGNLVTLTAEESRHVSVVLKMAAGDDLELFDGSGCCYRARIELVGRAVQTRILAVQSEELIKGPPLWLVLADLKGKKMDLVIQKSTELGVHTVVPFFSSRSQGRKNEERKRSSLTRRRKLIESACKQCRRLTLMNILEEVSFDEMIDITAKINECQKLMLWEKEHQETIGQSARRTPAAPILLMVGPEGGFSASEVATARGAGWQTISLGSRVLRAETAAISAVAIVQFQVGGL